MRRPIQLHNPIYAALTFAAYGDPEKMAEAAAENIREVQRVAGLLESILEQSKDALDFGARAILIGAIEHLRAEERWIERVRQEGFGI